MLSAADRARFVSGLGVAKLGRSENAATVDLNRTIGVFANIDAMTACLCAS